MVTESQTKLYREKVSKLLMALRHSLYSESGCVSYPSDSFISKLLFLSPTALSSVSRQCSSISGLGLFFLLHELSKHCSKDLFVDYISEFLCSPN